jgi:hypothetical protein
LGDRPASGWEGGSGAIIVWADAIFDDGARGGDRRDGGDVSWSRKQANYRCCVSIIELGADNSD